MVNWKKKKKKKKKKKNPSQVHVKDFVHRRGRAFCEFHHRYFSMILLIDSELRALKMDFFKDIFQEFCWQISE